MFTPHRNGVGVNACAHRRNVERPAVVAGGLGAAVFCDHQLARDVPNLEGHWSIAVEAVLDARRLLCWVRECREQFDIRDINKKRAEAYKSLI